MPARPDDRREGPRVCIQRDAKISADGSGRFLPARTVNVSARGVLLEVDSARPLAIGQPVRLAIQWQDAALLRAAAMLPGRIVRTEEGERPRIAMRLDRPMTEARGASEEPARAAA